MGNVSHGTITIPRANTLQLYGQGAKLWCIRNLVQERYRRYDKQLTLCFSICLTLETAILHGSPHFRGLGLDAVADIRSQTAILLLLEQLWISCAAT